MSTIDGLTVEERGGPEADAATACGRYATHYAGCACHEAAWAERLAAAEAVARECKAQYHARRDALIAAEARAKKLEEALREIETHPAYGCVPSCPDVPTLPRAAWCLQCIARAALAPPPKAEKKGEEAPNTMPMDPADGEWKP